MTEMPLSAPDRTPRLTLAETQEFLAAEFPQMALGGPTYSIEEVGYGSAKLRLLVRDEHLRPGGTVSGPAMMALADIALYVALLGAIGRVPLAVTTSFSINFLRRPEPKDVICIARYLKIGRSLAVGEAELTTGGVEGPVGHVVATYSIPPKG